MTNSDLKIKQNNGAAIILAMSVLMFVTSLIVISSAKSIKANTQVTRNQILSDNAFEASEAGMDTAIAHLQDNQFAIIVDNSENGGDGNGYIDPYSNSAINNVDNGNGTTFNVTYTNPNANDLTVIEIDSVGTSDSGQVSETIHQLVYELPFVSITPYSGFTTQGNVNLGGNVSVTNNVNNTSIWSGGSATLSGSASANGDIVQNDSQLSSLSGDEFFESMIGVDKATAKDNANIHLTYTSDQNISAVLDPDSNNGKSIWVDQQSGSAKLSGNSTIGTADKPVVLIIDGDFKANGNTEIYGLVYVTQDWNNTGGGNLTIHGAVIVEGSFSGTGTPNIIYDDDVLNNVNRIAIYTRIPGSWRDF